jgi:hypothetical protein
MHQENLVVVGIPYDMFDLAFPKKLTSLLLRPDRSLSVDWKLDFVEIEMNLRAAYWCGTVPEFLAGTYEAGQR